MSAAIGSHGLLDLYGCPPEPLRDAAKLQSAMEQAARQAGACILSAHFHRFGGHGGITGVLLLAESHLSIHTWPEHHYAAADIFLCGSLNPAHARLALEQALQAGHSRWQQHPRGLPALFAQPETGK